MGNTSTTYQPASPDLLFLVTDQHTYHYKHLYQFQYALNQFLTSETSTQRIPCILAVGEQSVPITFIIAACWNLQIPFIPLSADQFRASPEFYFESFPITHYFFSSDISYTPPSEASPLPSSLESMIERGNNSNIQSSEDFHTRGEKIFGTFHSSGTTGPPKRIPLKRRQMLYGAAGASRYITPDEGALWLLCLPPYHIGGTAVILRSLIYNTGMYLLSTFDPQKIAELLTHTRDIQVASLVPTMLQRILSNNSFTPHPNFKRILLGGGPVSPSLIQQSLDRNISLINSYGMTETCAQITAQPIDTRVSRKYYESVGKVFNPNQIQIRSEDGDQESVNKTGIIWLRGPQLLDGYESKRLNEEAFDNNRWFNTGDYGYLDENGRLYIKMRRTDRIVSGGKNINPHEVEHLLQEWEKIRDVAVIGRPDEEWGEVATAFIVAPAQQQVPTHKEVKNFLKHKLASYKIPKKVIAREKLPRTAVGKIRREALKNEENE